MVTTTPANGNDMPPPPYSPRAPSIPQAQGFTPASAAPRRPQAPVMPPATPPAPPAPTGTPPERPLKHPLPPPSPQVEAFFSRCSLPSSTRQLCWDFTHSLYPSSATPLAIHECATQGYCSYTFLVSDTQIIQFRPRAHQLNTILSSLARGIYGPLAPDTRFLGILPVPSSSEPAPPLSVYTMACMPGVSLADFRRNPTARAAGEVRLQRAILARDFARFLSLGWKNRQTSGVRKGCLPITGRLAGSLRQRLEMMRDKLPIRFRPVVLDVLQAMDAIEALPWVLTHGDVTADNVMVEADHAHRRGTGWRPGTLRGLLDWTESEYLPFGVGLYGVEELFGQSVPRWGGEGARSRFAYYPEAGDLRRVFWRELESAVPVLAGDGGLRGTVERAGVLGILLWHGIAWDDGAIDRVVEEGRDDEEVQKLDMFLFGTDHPVARERFVTASEEEGTKSGSKQPVVTVTVTDGEKEGSKRGWCFRQRSSKV